MRSKSYAECPCLALSNAIFELHIDLVFKPIVEEDDPSKQTGDVGCRQMDGRPISQSTFMHSNFFFGKFLQKALNLNSDLSWKSLTVQHEDGQDSL